MISGDHCTPPQPGRGWVSPRAPLVISPKLRATIRNMKTMAMVTTTKAEPCVRRAIQPRINATPITTRPRNQVLMNGCQPNWLWASATR